ncbi:MAG TPA: signal peptide peptidase SppA [Dehalococcoidia bacterium]|nr:signal peptide peptidase SppA [Dehalococcoidia bacterium]
MNLPLPNRPRVAVVEMNGTIGGGVRSRSYAPLFKALREDRGVRALVLDIDSPGGSASESDYLYGQIRRAAARKPVIAFIRGTGASGAYFIACAGQRIIAQRSSIIGSIGVITIRPQVQELLEKIGVKVSVTATGPLKGMGLPFREESEQEKAKNEALVGAFFEHFIDVVAAGRKVSKETVRGWATGEVFWAPQALERGMVDELGDLEHAVAVAAKLVDISPKQAVTVRPKLPFPQRLLQRAAAASLNAARAEAERLFAARVEYR